MTVSTFDAQRSDPYKNFKFRVKWDGRYVAGISKISSLRRSTEVLKHRLGADPSTTRKSPAHCEFEPITLERGVTHDPEFEAWAARLSQINAAGLDTEVSLRDSRKDLSLDFYNDSGQLAIGFKIYRAWASEYLAVPDMDANANAVAIQHLILEHEGWELEVAAAEPT